MQHSLLRSVKSALRPETDFDGAPTRTWISRKQHAPRRLADIDLDVSKRRPPGQPSPPCARAPSPGRLKTAEGSGHLLRELARSETTALRNESQAHRLPPVGANGRSASLYSHGQGSLGSLGSPPRHSSVGPRAFSTSSVGAPAREREAERRHEGGAGVGHAASRLAMSHGPGDLQDFGVLDASKNGSYGAEERHQHLTEIEELRKQCAELQAQVQLRSRPAPGRPTAPTRFEAAKPPARWTRRGFACLAACLHEWRHASRAARRGALLSKCWQRSAATLRSMEAVGLRRVVLRAWAVAAHAEAARSRALCGSQHLLRGVAASLQHSVLVAWLLTAQSKKAVGQLQAQVYREQAVRYGLVHAEQRKCQASLVEMEAVYGDELQSLRAELSEVEARYQNQQQLMQEEATALGSATDDPLSVLLGEGTPTLVASADLGATGGRAPLAASANLSAAAMADWRSVSESSSTGDGTPIF